MWTIRTDQMEALRQSGVKEYEDRLIKHLHGFIPKLAVVLGDDGLRKVIYYGMDRAQPYGFTSEACIQFFVEMIFLFGAEFDYDPQYPWAEEILNDKSITEELDRGDRLCEKAKEYLEAVNGPDREFVMQALRKVRDEPFDGPSKEASDFERRIKERLRSVYPEKCTFIGEKALSGLIGRGLEESRKHSVTSNAGIATMIGLSFTVGHGMARDPHVPWIARTLNNAAIEDPNKRAERLHAKAMTYLDEILASL